MSILGIPMFFLACLGGSPIDAFASTDCASVTGDLVANCGFEGGTYSGMLGGNTNGSVVTNAPMQFCGVA